MANYNATRGGTQTVYSTVAASTLNFSRGTTTATGSYFSEEDKAKLEQEK